MDFRFDKDYHRSERCINQKFFSKAYTSGHSNRALSTTYILIYIYFSLIESSDTSIFTVFVADLSSLEWYQSSSIFLSTEKAIIYLLGVYPSKATRPPKKLNSTL